MKIAIFTDGPNLAAHVAHRVGTAKWLLLIDTDSGELEAVPYPAVTSAQGTGVKAIALAVNLGAQVILTGQVNAVIARQFETKDIEILSGFKGSVKDVLQEYQEGLVKMNTGKAPFGPALLNTTVLIQATRSAARQFGALLPVLMGVVMLVGLFNVFITKELLMPVFSGRTVQDTFSGACFGSIFAGNPINSYVIGGELLKDGVSLTAVTAFLMTWVTVGLVQLPAETAALGRRFALLRNGLSFVLSIPIALFTVMILDFVGRWIS